MHGLAESSQAGRVGLSQLAYRGAQTLLRHLGGSGQLCIHHVIAVTPEQLRLPARLPRELRVRELTAEDVSGIEALRRASGVAYGERLRCGHRAAGAFLPASGGQRLVAFVWVVPGPARLPNSFGCAWQIPAAVAWLYDLYSDPGVLGTVPHLYQYLRQRPPVAGLRCLMGQNDFDNLRTRRAHASLGYRVKAELWTLRRGSACLHWVRWRQRPHWRWLGSGAAIPLAEFLAGEAWPAATARCGLWLQCVCGAEVALSGERFVCSHCGRELGVRRGGVADAGRAMSYWGEIPQAEMQKLLSQAEDEGWRAVVRQRLPARLAEYVASRSRAGFHEVLPLPPRARVLDVGAGWGSIAAPLARRYEVLALEGVEERARFIALRQRQDGLEQLSVVRGEIHSTPLASRQFDAVIANGVLEWSALLDTNDPPRAVQLRFLLRLRELLRPGGIIYLGIENRCGWEALRGATDHSGLPYTSLMPRWLAHRICLRRQTYRADVNSGYRTYTYTYRGYLRLFGEAGLGLRASWVSPWGYNSPGKLVPLHAAAIRFGASRWGRRAWLRHWTAQPWIWRWLGSDFVFLLQAVEEIALTPKPQDRQPERAHA